MVSIILFICIKKNNTALQGKLYHIHFAMGMIINEGNLTSCYFFYILSKRVKEIAVCFSSANMYNPLQMLIDNE